MEVGIMPFAAKRELVPCGLVGKVPEDELSMPAESGEEQVFTPPARGRGRGARRGRGRGGYRRGNSRNRASSRSENRGSTPRG